ncbi:hypothetical protein M8J75_008653 [Diaphorina citri]|nr:hypothetical protein M8J75_008653 [Diaphorina citri]
MKRTLILFSGSVEIVEPSGLTMSHGTLAQWYQTMEEKYADPRMKEYFLMDTPVPMLVTLASYIFFVNYLGPKLMENRKPFNLSTIIKIYNVAQMTCNFYLVYVSFKLVWLTDSYRYDCIEIDYSDTPMARRKLTMVWVCFMSRLLDLLDTIFFVLRKKQKQISFLHVYHHSFVFFFGWLIAKALPGGQVAFFGTVNSFVHGVMYGYYLVSAFDPQNKWNLWWKKYITQLQLFQFIICGIHCTIQLCSSNCKYPQFMLYFGLSQDIFMFFLFFDFYKKTYWSTPKAKVQ